MATTGSGASATLGDTRRMNGEAIARLLDEPSPARSLARALHLLDIEQRRIRTRFAGSLGLSLVEFNAVMHITEVGEITPKALASELGLTPGAVTAMLDRLEQGHFIRRWPHPTDRRSLVIALDKQASGRGSTSTSPTSPPSAQRSTTTRSSASPR